MWAWRPRLGPTAIAWIAVMTLACALRVVCFQSYPSGWDSCEYVYVVEHRLLPHSAYVIHIWLGMLVGSILPVGVGLSVISFVSGIAVVILTGALVGHLSGSKPAGIIAAGAMAGFPVYVWYSSIQEVYMLQSALVLGALYAATRNRPVPLVGLLLGLAAGAHSGTVFLVPAMALLVLTDRRRGPLWRRLSHLVEIGAITIAILAVCYGWIYWVGEWDRVGGAGVFLEYLAGIRPLRNPASGLGSIVRRYLFHSIDKAVLITPASVSLLGLMALILLAARRLRFMAIWALMPLPYSIYYFIADPQVEGGIAMVYTVPTLAAVTGAAAGLLLSWHSSNRPSDGRLDLIRVSAASVAALIVIVFVLAPSMRAAVMAMEVPSRAEFLASGAHARLVALRNSVPAGTVIVQPTDVSNVNLAPCLSGLRPIIFQDRTFRITPPGDWVPMLMSLLPPLSNDHLDALLKEGTTVVSLTPDVFTVPGIANKLDPGRYRWREVRLAQTGSDAVYVLEAATQHRQ